MEEAMKCAPSLVFSYMFFFGGGRTLIILPRAPRTKVTPLDLGQTERARQRHRVNNARTYTHSHTDSEPGSAQVQAERKRQTDSQFEISKF